MSDSHTRPLKLIAFLGLFAALFVAMKLFLPLLVLLCALSASAAETTLRVMSFNIWVGGEAGKQPISQSAKVIKAANADLIGLQETRGHAQNGQRPDNALKLAETLKFHYLDQGDNRGLLSRFPIVTNTPRKFGAKVRLPSGQSVWLFNVHLAHAPYQPYQLLSIPYADGAFLKTADEAIQAAAAARGHQIKAVLDEVRAFAADDSPVFLTGDFNEPSHQDWTKRAARENAVPLPVLWPTTRAVVAAGFTDSYRKAFPNEVTHRGITWTPITPEDDPKDRHDRIDMIFFKGPNVSVARSEIVGEKPERADIVVTPYPSDHRAVLSTFRLK